MHPVLIPVVSTRLPQYVNHRHSQPEDVHHRPMSYADVTQPDQQWPRRKQPKRVQASAGATPPYVRLQNDNSATFELHHEHFVQPWQQHRSITTAVVGC
jgi:hypothetical protein